jgi:CheY-like chemotaxis protein
MTVSILVVDDESDIAELFRQRFHREVRQGTYAMHFANSDEEASLKNPRFRESRCDEQIL